MDLRQHAEFLVEQLLREERARIRRELEEAIEAASSVVQLSEAGEDLGEPVEMVEKEDMLAALDRIIPEEP
jgi:hypothetical protein